MLLYVVCKLRAVNIKALVLVCVLGILIEISMYCMRRDLDW